MLPVRRSTPALHSKPHQHQPLLPLHPRPSHKLPTQPHPSQCCQSSALLLRYTPYHGSRLQSFAALPVSVFLSRLFARAVLCCPSVDLQCAAPCSYPGRAIAADRIRFDRNCPSHHLGSTCFVCSSIFSDPLLPLRFGTLLYYRERSLPTRCCRLLPTRRAPAPR